MSRTLLCSPLLFGLVACSTASSTDIKTSGINADLSGTGDGSGSTNVSATLRVGAESLTFVELSVGDTLTAKSGSDSPHALSKVDFLGLVSYSTTLPGDEEGKSVTVALNRAPGDTSAPNSSLTLPAKFQILGPSSGTSFKRGTDAISVTWDNWGKADRLDVQLTGSCITSVTHTSVPDNGSFVIAASEIKAIKDSETKACDLSLTVNRTRAGTLDPAYGKGGQVRGIQSRSISVKSTP